MNSLSSRRLHLQVKDTLLKEFLHGEYAKADMLPSESELCERLQISRGTLRHAVTSLEQEGYLKRRQGIGTIIDRNICSIKARMDLKIEFSDLLKQSGYKPSTNLLEIREELAGEENARLLQINPEDTLLSITKEWLADGRPAILCTDIFPTNLIREPYVRDIFENDIFHILRKLCHEEVDYQIARIVPCCLSEELSKVLLVPPNVPIVSFTGVGFNYDGNPVLCNTEYYAPGILDFTFLRARI